MLDIPESAAAYFAPTSADATFALEEPLVGVEDRSDRPGEPPPGNLFSRLGALKLFRVILVGVFRNARGWTGSVRVTTVRRNYGAGGLKDLPRRHCTVSLPICPQQFTNSKSPLIPYSLKVYSGISPPGDPLFWKIPFQSIFDIKALSCLFLTSVITFICSPLSYFFSLF